MVVQWEQVTLSAPWSPQHRVNEMLLSEGVTPNGEFEGRSTEALYGLAAAGLRSRWFRRFTSAAGSLPVWSCGPLVPNIQVDAVTLLPNGRPVSLVVGKFISVLKDAVAQQSGPAAGARGNGSGA